MVGGGEDEIGTFHVGVAGMERLVALCSFAATDLIFSSGCFVEFVHEKSPRDAAGCVERGG